jgi:hypothetical protein
MRKSTGRALRISFTGVGVAAMGLAFAGAASADELPGGVLGGQEKNSDSGQTGQSGFNENGYYDNGYYDQSQSSGPLSAADSVTNMAGMPGVDDTAGGATGGATGMVGLDSFQMPISHRSSADGNERSLPIVSLAGLDQVTEDNNLLNGAGTFNTGLDTPGITGLKIPLLD